MARAEPSSPETCEVSVCVPCRHCGGDVRRAPSFLPRAAACPAFGSAIQTATGSLTVNESKRMQVLSTEESGVREARGAKRRPVASDTPMRHELVPVVSGKSEI